jgi:glutamyl-tRNA synthetase
MSDPVLIRADGSFLYTLPSVVDDIDMGITDIIRGEDHVSNTGVQLELFDALGGVRPGFAHHNLLTDGEGQGLSKRLKSLSISQLREDGFEPLAVDILASVTGTSFSVEPVASLEALIERFEFDQISRAPARFGMGELETLNARLLHELDFAAAARSDLPEGLGETVWNALRPNLEKFSDINGLWEIVKGPIQPVVAPEDRAFIDAAREALPGDPWDDEVWPAWTAKLKESTGRKGRDLFHPLRLALTGQESGPELKALMPLIGRKGCLDRLA